MNNDNNNSNFDINSIINGTPGSNPNDTGVNQFPGGVVQQNVNPNVETQQVPFTTGENIPNMNTDTINNMSSGDDPNAMINENLKKVEIHEYKPPGKYQMFLLIVFFIFIILFAVFLPEISTFINLYKSGKLNQVEEEITTGKLTCTLKSNTANLDMDYVRVFYFDSKMLTKAEFSLTTRGDATEDEKTLDDLKTKCEKLKEHSKYAGGFTVSCESSTGKVVETQSYNYASIDESEINSAFAEIGGTVPEFSNGEDIDKIEHSMNAAGYSCFKEK